MFRKPKRKVKDSLRRPGDGKEDDVEIASTTTSTPTSELIAEARKRLRPGDTNDTSFSNSTQSSLMHSYQSKEGEGESRASKHAELATRSAQHHSQEGPNSIGTASRGEDGIFRDNQRNKFHAGPVRAAQNIRVTARFDYQPDICKDYKETGFCGFGDTCIYLHDRGDTLTGWQLEQQWEEEQRKKKEQQEKEMQDFADGNVAESVVNIPDDGLPFACFLCREHFKDPVVTHCNHYFCERCIMEHVQKVNNNCPICSKDTVGVFNQPVKLIAKKRRLLGTSRASAADSWEQFFLDLQKHTNERKE